MEELGRNPARIIPAWKDFIGAFAARGRPVRGIGEPIWPGRSPDELVECHHHESLLNFAFDDGPAWWLLCPYDADGLDDEVLSAARHTHPEVSEDGSSAGSDAYLAPGAAPSPFEGPLAEPPAEREEIAFFSATELAGLRAFVAGHAAAAGLEGARAADLVLAVDELATNSLRHGGGEGVLRVWTEPGDARLRGLDSGRIDWPLAGRERPLPEMASGRGVWIVNQLCDLVQIRALPEGNVVRVRMATA